MKEVGLKGRGWERGPKQGGAGVCGLEGEGLRCGLEEEGLREEEMKGRGHTQHKIKEAEIKIKGKTHLLISC